MQGLAEGVVLGLAAGGRQSEIQAKLRDPGHPLLPVAKVQAGWQSITSDLQAVDYQLLLGHGLIGAEFRHTHFRERDADSHLDLFQAHLLYRMAVTHRIQWNLGVGGAWLNGQETQSGISFATPLRWWPLEWLGLELQPAWTWFNSVRLNDVDAGLVLRYRRVNVHAGYRWLESNNDAASLSGFRMGVGWRF